MAEKRFIEQLSHFNCINCKKWWSVADAPVERDEWYCAWCGAAQASHVEEDDDDKVLDK